VLVVALIEWPRQARDRLEENSAKEQPLFFVCFFVRSFVRLTAFHERLHRSSDCDE
jgi:hypothetical protein